MAVPYASYFCESQYTPIYRANLYQYGYGYYLNRNVLIQNPDNYIPPENSGDSGNGNGSINLNETNSLIGSVDSSLNNAFNNDTSSINSGDMVIDNSQFDIDDPTYNFFNWVLTQLQNILTSNSVSSMTFNLFGETYTVRSDFFVLPDNALRLFLTSYYTFITGYLILKDIRKIIESFKNGNIEEIGKEDINANMV